MSPTLAPGSQFTMVAGVSKRRSPITRVCSSVGVSLSGDKWVDGEPGAYV